MRRSPGSLLKQTTAIFESDAPLADGSVQVLVMLVAAQLATIIASVRAPMAQIAARTLSFTLASMMLILRLGMVSVGGTWGATPRGTTATAVTEGPGPVIAPSAYALALIAATADTSRPCSAAA